MLDVSPGVSSTLPYRVYAFMVGSDLEVDITDRSIFWVSDNHLAGSFPSNLNVFSSNAEDPRGGIVTVSAIAANADTTTTAVATTLNLRLLSTLADPRADALAPLCAPAAPRTNRAWAGSRRRPPATL